MFKEVPERVVELVQKMLDSSPEIKSQDSVSMETKSHEGVTMVLNIWDFAGKEAYYTTHNLFLTSRAIYIIVFNLNQDFNDIEVSEVSSHADCRSVCNSSLIAQCLVYLTQELVITCFNNQSFLPLTFDACD